jgi:hypothetical protein
MRKTGDQAGVQRIDSIRVHDQDGRSRFLDGKGRRRCDHNYDVHIQANHLSCKPIMPVAGDDAGRKAGEMALVGKLGFEPVDAGLLKNRCAVLMGLPTGPL